jgi:hypothetical protein
VEQHSINVVSLTQCKVKFSNNFWTGILAIRDFNNIKKRELIQETSGANCQFSWNALCLILLRNTLCSLALNATKQTWD